MPNGYVVSFLGCALLATSSIASAGETDRTMTQVNAALVAEGDKPVEPGRVEGLHPAHHAYYVVGGDNDTIFGLIFSSADDYCTRDRDQNKEPPGSTNVIATLHNFRAGENRFPVQSISDPKTDPTYASVKIEVWDDSGKYAGGEEIKDGYVHIAPRNLHDDIVAGDFSLETASGETLRGAFKARACTSLR